MNKLTNYEKYKEKRLIYQKDWYEKNKEHVKAYQKEYQKKYRQNPEAMERKKKFMRERSAEYSKRYRERHPDKAKQSAIKWQVDNAERWKKYQLEYRKRPSVKKATRIANWKQIGVKDHHFSELYEYYIKETNCMICGEEFKTHRHRHLDHDHETGEVRYICCAKCNTKLLGKDREKKNICIKINDEC
tara:strand:- start:820 stop:1383 length:564 start_codon:yes stop_codon:yes gene_type:complete